MQKRVSIRTVGLVLATTIAGVPLHAAKSVPEVVGYLLASSSESGDAPATWQYNAIDGKPTTAWCTRGDGMGQQLVLGFMRAETITHIAIVPGSVVGEGVDRNHARVREIELNDGRERRTITLADKADAQELAITPPVVSRQLTITIKDVFPSENELTPGACIGEIALKNGPQLLTGDAVARLLRSVPRNQLPLTGPWLDEPSATERFLTFYLDGSFTWVFEPLMDGDPVTVTGTYKVSSGRITLEPKGGKPSIFTLERDRVSSREGTFETLTVTGEGVHEKFAGTYQPAVRPASK